MRNWCYLEGGSRESGVSDAVGGVGYPGVEPEAYISGGRPLACVLCDGGDCVVSKTWHETGISTLGV